LFRERIREGGLNQGETITDRCAALARRRV
jgi:hypothetical protein